MASPSSYGALRAPLQASADTPAVTHMTEAHFKALLPRQVQGLIDLVAQGERVVVQTGGHDLDLLPYLRRTAH